MRRLTASLLYYFIEMGYGSLLKVVGLDILWDLLLGPMLPGAFFFLPSGPGVSGGSWTSVEVKTTYCFGAP